MCCGYKQNVLTFSWAMVHFCTGYGPFNIMQNFERKVQNTGGGHSIHCGCGLKLICNWTHNENCFMKKKAVTDIPLCCKNG